VCWTLIRAEDKRTKCYFDRGDKGTLGERKGTASISPQITRGAIRTLRTIREAIDHPINIT